MTRHDEGHWDGSDRRNDASSERLARLEVLFSNLDHKFETELVEARAERKEMLELMREVKGEMGHYKGVVGGIALVFSGIAVVLGILKGWLLK